MKTGILNVRKTSAKRVYSRPALSKIGNVKTLTKKTGSQTDIFTMYTA